MCLKGEHDFNLSPPEVDAIDEDAAASLRSALDTVVPGKKEKSDSEEVWLRDTTQSYLLAWKGESGRGIGALCKARTVYYYSVFI